MVPETGSDAGKRKKLQLKGPNENVYFNNRNRTSARNFVIHNRNKMQNPRYTSNQNKLKVLKIKKKLFYNKVGNFDTLGITVTVST